MKDFIRKWSNWWILNPNCKQLDDAFEKELNELIEREVALHIHDVSNLRELLCAFFKYFRDNGEANIGMTIEEFVDGFLSTQ